MGEEKWDEIPNPPPSADSTPSTADAPTKKDFERTEIETLREQLTALQTDRQQRVEYARKTFGLMCWWLIGVGGLLLLSGGGAPHGFFQLSDAVLVALVTGVSVNVIGTFAIVMNYLFRAGAAGQPAAANVPRKEVQ